MPRDFKNFTRDNFNQQNKNDIPNNSKTQEYEEIINKYKNMDSSNLMANLLSEASKLKKEGKLDSSSLESLKTTLAPFLNPEQKNMLNSLINTINEQK